MDPKGKRTYEFRPDGLGYVLTYTDIDTSFHVDRLKVTGGDTKGDVMVRTNIKGARTYANNLLHYSRETLSSSTARKSFGRVLAEKVPSDPPIDWFGMYDEFCTAVMLADREGQPPEAVGTMADDIVGPAFLLRPMVPFGVHSILFGDGGLGKSILTLALGVSHQTGKEIVPGFIPVQQGNTLVLNWETNRSDIDARIKAICAGAGIPTVQMYHLLGGGRTLASRVEAIARAADQTDSTFLIVDSIGKAIGTAGEGPIEDAANRFSSALDEIGRSTLCIDHVSKAGVLDANGAGKPIGSTMKSNWARATWEMRPQGPQEDGTSHLVLHHRKHNTTDEHPPIALSMQWRKGAVVWESEPVIANPYAFARAGAPLADRIAEALADHPLRPREIAIELNTNEATVRTVLNRQKGRFEKLPTGDWGLMEAGA